MNTRLQLTDIAARLAAVLGPSVYVSTMYKRDFLTAFGVTYPAVWVSGQRLIASEDGSGSGAHRQLLRAEVRVTIVVQRYADGSTNQETALNTLHDDVTSALFGWTAPNSERQLVWVSSNDGPPSDSIHTADLIFGTRVVYQKDG